MSEKITTITQLLEAQLSTLYTITTNYNSDTLSIVNYGSPIIIKKGEKKDKLKEWFYVALGIGFKKKLNIKLSIVNNVNPNIIQQLNMNNITELINMLILNETAPIGLFMSESDAILALNSMKYNIKQKIETDPILTPMHKKLYFDKRPIINELSNSLTVAKFEEINPSIMSLINLYKECIIE